jgi:hypothetical protein
MSLNKSQIKAAALELDPAEREALAEELLLSLSDEESQAIDAAWLAEARRRDAAFAAGSVLARPVDDVVDRLTRRTAQ